MPGSDFAVAHARQEVLAGILVQGNNYWFSYHPDYDFAFATLSTF
jgi:hypothetical protein